MAKRVGGSSQLHRPKPKANIKKKLTFLRPLNLDKLINACRDTDPVSCFSLKAHLFRGAFYLLDHLMIY